MVLIGDSITTVHHAPKEIEAVIEKIIKTYRSILTLSEVDELWIWVNNNRRRVQNKSPSQVMNMWTEELIATSSSVH